MGLLKERPGLDSDSKSARHPKAGPNTLSTLEHEIESEWRNQRWPVEAWVPRFQLQAGGGWEGGGVEPPLGQIGGALSIPAIESPTSPSAGGQKTKVDEIGEGEGVNWVNGSG